MRRAHIGETQMQPTNEMLEEENSSLESSLSNKVKALKHLTIDIGTEVRTHNKLLSEMDNDFESSTGLLESSIARVKAIARTGGWRFILYLVLFSLFVFFVCYVILKFR
ncbi:BET1 homolog [Liolophura sinensis]|uniref:BET1 homolog n=1 Tax=Liolophura sinensis TaxID=3198878 RepID=UPI003158ECF8